MTQQHAIKIEKTNEGYRALILSHGGNGVVYVDFAAEHKELGLLHDCTLDEVEYYKPTLTVDLAGNWVSDNELTPWELAEVNVHNIAN